MYSSAMPTVDDPTANRVTMPPASSTGLPPSRAMASPIRASTAPVARSTPNTPPTMRMKKMMSAASANPAGTAVRNVKSGSGSASTAR